MKPIRRMARVNPFRKLAYEAYHGMKWVHKTFDFAGNVFVFYAVCGAIVVGIIKIWPTILPAGSGFADKTLWNWLELIIIPLLLVIFGFRLQVIQQERLKHDQNENALQAYIEKISEYLIDKDLLNNPDDIGYAGEGNSVESFRASYLSDCSRVGLVESVSHVIRAMTLSLLRKLDGDGVRKAAVILFLADTGATRKLPLDLSWADFSGSRFTGGRYLKNVSLKGVNLSNSFLNMANLEKSDLSWAVLQKSNLAGVILTNARLESALVREANLESAFLDNTNCRFADMQESNLRNAVLINVDLRGSDLSDADLRDSILLDCDMSEARVNKIELLGAKINNTTLPDGQPCNRNDRKELERVIEKRRKYLYQNF